MRTLWFIALMSAICLEGLGRKYLPMVPSVGFYFLKDAILLVGLLRFRPPQIVKQTARYLYRGFEVARVAAFVVTLLQMVNPEQQSVALAVVGLRGYWLWWIAPPIIAGVLQSAQQKRRAIYTLLTMAIGVSTLAMFQFAAPANSALNLYSVVDGEEVYSAGSAVVASTGRARVSGTFSFVTGFSDFTILVPALLLSIGLEARDTKLRRLALLATLATASVVPMSGSRSSVLFGVGILVLAIWSAGLVFTRIGRRVAVGALVAAVLSAIAFPDALVGVQDRFSENQEETSERLQQLATVLPPLALTMNEYPILGIGTGMQQNARGAFHVYTPWNEEYETARYLVELGPVGFILVWAAKLGLMVALLRAFRLLKNAGKRGSAAAALSYAALTMTGNLVFDHVWQSLFFVGCGFILAEVVAVKRAALEASNGPAGFGPGPIDSGQSQAGA
jgi:hypothetical protein